MMSSSHRSPCVLGVIYITLLTNYFSRHLESLSVAENINAVVLEASKVNVSWQNKQWPIYNEWSITDRNESDKVNSTTFQITVYMRGNDSSEWSVVSSGNVDNTWILITDLLPYSYYQFGLSDNNNSIPELQSAWIRTSADAPSAPPVINKTSVVLLPRAICFEFEPPPESYWNGPLLGYTLSYSRQYDQNQYKTILAPSVRSHNITDLQPYQVYYVHLSAYNEAGDGPGDDFSRRTDEEVPSQPYVLKVLSRNDTSLVVKWEQPRHPNGKLLGYLLYYTHNATRLTVNVTIPWANQYFLTGLYPYTTYDLQIAAYNSKGEGELSNVYPVMTDVAAPSAPEIEVHSNQSDAVIVKWLSPVVFTKQIDRYIITCETVTNISTANRMKEIRVDDFDLLSDSFEWLITGLEPNMLYRVRVAGATKSIDLSSDRYYIGTYSNSVDVTTMSVSESLPSAASIGIIAGIICTVVILIIFIVGFIVVRHCMQNHYQYIGDQDQQSNSKRNTAPRELILTPLYDQSCCHRDAVGVDKFEEHVTNLHADGDYLLSQEYEEINRQVPVSSSTTQSLLDDNKQKNRYLNILAYDHSRVILKPIPGKPRHLEYINANYIDGYSKPKAYIATQGPTPSTFGDFWRMVWEQESVVIVMITKLVEKGRRKCDQYWPNEGEQQYDGGFTVRLISTCVTAHYTVRTFALRSKQKKRYSSLVGSVGTTTSAERVVYQYHYTDWPDHGVPAYTLPTLAFVAKSTAANPSNAGPIIVHCSAGVGRTGTYIVLDSMIRQIKDTQTVNVFDFLLHIRNQRSYLVQTEDQYSFVHDALVEFIRSGGDTEVKDTNVSQYIRQLTTVDDNGCTLLHKQYELLISFEPKPFHFQSACSTINETKNRSTSILPVELSRVHLTPKPGVDGSDYINASFLQGYGRNDEYIITQHPLDDTVADFWNMIYDQNSATIVLLTATDDADWKVFWPQKDNDTVDYGSCQVAFQKQSTEGHYSYTDFLLQSTQDDYGFVVKMIACPCWPSAFNVQSGVFELVNKVKAWQAEREQTQGPVIVVDRYGGVEAATFCALMTLFDAIQHEACVDIYTVCKLYHTKRPNVFPSEDDYLFLYKAVESLCSDESSLHGDKDSGIANCNNYAVGNHQQEPSSPGVSGQPTTPRSPSPASSKPSSPLPPRSTSDDDELPTLHPTPSMLQRPSTSKLPATTMTLSPSHPSSSPPPSPTSVSFATKLECELPLNDLITSQSATCEVPDSKTTAEFTIL